MDNILDLHHEDYEKLDYKGDSEERTPLPTTKLCVECPEL